MITRDRYVKWSNIQASCYIWVIRNSYITFKNNFWMEIHHALTSFSLSINFTFRRHIPIIHYMFIIRPSHLSVACSFRFRASEPISSSPSPSSEPATIDPHHLFLYGKNCCAPWCLWLWITYAFKLIHTASLMIPECPWHACHVETRSLLCVRATEIFINVSARPWACIVHLNYLAK